MASPIFQKLNSTDIKLHFLKCLFYSHLRERGKRGREKHRKIDLRGIDELPPAHSPEA